MPAFFESGIAFSFNEEWLVRKYDAHTYFKGFSGVGLKGVDFISIYQKRQLVLIEVKNYRSQVPGRKGSHHVQSLANPSAIASSLGLKATDTLKAIRAIGLYYERKWFYRIVRPWVPRLRKIMPEWHFWTTANSLAQESQIIFLCWLEFDAEHQHLSEIIRGILGDQLKSQPFQIQAVNTATNPFGPSLAAR